MILSIAWKNIWRNKLRSAVVIVAVTFGLFGGVFVVGMMQGMVQQKFKNTLSNEISHLQIHNVNFLENNEAEFYIENAEEIINELEQIPQIKSVCSRTLLTAMAYTSHQSAGIRVFGIDPDKEKEVTTLYSTILDSAGNYFESDKKNQILVGDNLARSLEIVNYIITDKTLATLKDLDVPSDILSKLEKIKDEVYRNEKYLDEALVEILGENNQRKFKFIIVEHSQEFKLNTKINLTFQDKNGEMVNKSFKVCGIYDSKNGMYDGMNVFVRSEDLEDLTGYSNANAHEIAIMLNNIEDADIVKQKLMKKYPNLDIQTYIDLDPFSAIMTVYMQIFHIIFVGIILAALGFGIVNTMLMVVLERVKEIGMLMAVGMNKMKVFLMIMFESVFLSLTGGAIGMFLGYVTILITSKSGIDFSQWSKEGFESVGMDSLIYPFITPDKLVTITILVILTGVISAIYPARKALKYNPADAIRIDV